MNKLPFLYRLLIPIVLAISVGFVVLNVIMVSTVNENYGQAAIAGARDSLAAEAGALRSDVNESIHGAKDLARALSSMAEDSSVFNETSIMNLLVSLQKDNADLFYGVWANWLPQKYPDTVSDQYINDNHFAPMAFPDDKGGIVKITTTGHSGNDEKSLWFRNPISTGKLYVTEPTTYNIAGKDVTLVTIGYPIKNNGDIVGVAGVNMNVSYVRGLINSLDFNGLGHAFLITDEYKYFAYPKDELIGKDALAHFPELKEIHASLKEKIYLADDPISGESSELILMPITFKNSTEVLIMGMSIPEKELFAFLHRLTVDSMIIMLVSLALISGLVFYIIRQLVNKIGGEPDTVIEKITRIANGDLSEQQSNGKVRSDSLLAQVEIMRSNLYDLIEKLRENAANLDGSSEFLTNASGGLVKNTELQSKSSSQVAAASVEMTQTIREIAKDLIGMEEYAKETGAKAQAGVKVVQASTDGVLTIKTSADESTESVNALLESSDKIRDIVSVIGDIAEQTNLLALNAAIEAARAGEQGRGFAVVADEVRGLASRTQQATGEISDLVMGTQTDVGNVTKSMEQVSGQVSTGVELSGQVTESLELIVQSVDSLENRLGLVSSATKEMSTASEEVERNINDVASHSDDINQVASQISDQAESLRNMSSSVQQLVANFKL